MGGKTLTQPGSTSRGRVSQAIPVIILQRSFETGHFNPSHLTMTDPESNERERVNVARRSGTVVLTGTASIDSHGASLELVSTKTPYLPPTVVTWSLDAEKVQLVIDRLVRSGFYRSRKQPW